MSSRRRGDGRRVLGLRVVTTTTFLPSVNDYAAAENYSAPLRYTRQIIRDCGSSRFLLPGSGRGGVDGGSLTPRPPVDFFARVTRLRDPRPLYPRGYVPPSSAEIIFQTVFPPPRSPSPSVIFCPSYRRASGRQRIRDKHRPGHNIIYTRHGGGGPFQWAGNDGHAVPDGARDRSG